MATVEDGVFSCLASVIKSHLMPMYEWSGTSLTPTTEYSIRDGLTHSKIGRKYSLRLVLESLFQIL